MKLWVLASLFYKVHVNHTTCMCSVHVFTKCLNDCLCIERMYRNKNVGAVHLKTGRNRRLNK